MWSSVPFFKIYIWLRMQWYGVKPRVHLWSTFRSFTSLRRGSMNSHSQINLFIWRYVIIFVLRANWRGYNRQLQLLRLKIETTLVFLLTEMGGERCQYIRGTNSQYYTQVHMKRKVRIIDKTDLEGNVQAELGALCFIQIVWSLRTDLLG